jgi:exodeoxyribonuclease-3
VRLATWNVNSIRSRIDRVTDWLERADVDVLAMQETKCTDDQFPTMPFAALGYEVVHSGFSQWNGVAIASRVGIDDVAVGFGGQPDWAEASEARALGATCGGVRVWSLYVPNGRSLDDEHMPYKLKWLDTLKGHAAGWITENPETQVALMGDWNIAPLDEDVWDIDFFRANALTHVSEPEREAFRAFEAAGFTDVARAYTPGPGVYTYWDYTQLRFPKKEGMRIDFVMASTALAARVTGASIDREERKGKGASDHAPVIVELTD